MNWQQEIQRKQIEFFRKKELEAPTAYINPRTKRHSWTYVATRVSFAPSSVYPWNPHIARAIKSFTQGNLRPIWVVDIYRSPEDKSSPKLEKFGRHGLAQRCKESQAQFYHEGQPYKIWYCWTGEKDKRASDLPGAYIPFDGRVMKMVVANWRDRSKAEIQEFYHNQEDYYLKLESKGIEETQRLEDELQKYAKRKLEQLSDVEIKNYFLNRDLSDNQATGQASVLVGKHSRG